MDPGGLDPVPDNICACCDNPFLPHGMRGLLPQCGHQFHYACIMRWWEELEADSCPTCNQNFEEIHIRYPPGVRLNDAQRAREQDIELPDREDMCAVCHNSLDAAKCGKLACNHVFCLHCILQWTDHRPDHYAACPICREAFNEIRMIYPESRRRTRSMRREEDTAYIIVSSESEADSEPDIHQEAGELFDDGLPLLPDLGVPWDPAGYHDFDPHVFDPFHEDFQYHPELFPLNPLCRVCGNEAVEWNPVVQCAGCQLWWHGYNCQDQLGPPIRGIDGILRCFFCADVGVQPPPDSPPA